MRKSYNTTSTNCGDPYEELANAIILQAVADYRSSSRKLLKDPDDLEEQRQKKECKRFFLSDWYKKLTTVDGEMVLRHLEEEVDDYDS